MQMGAARLAGRRPRHRHTHRPGSAGGRPHRGSVRAEDGTGGSPPHDELHTANHVYCSVVSDGTSSVEMSPLALIARLAALVPPPKRHLTGYFGVLSSHSSFRRQCVPAPVPESTPQQEDKSPRTLPLSHYISWSQLLRRTFEIDITCPRCQSPLRLIALIKNGDTIKEILSAMGLPTEVPKPHPARPPPSEPGDGTEYLN